MCQTGWDVVEQHRKSTHPDVVKALCFFEQDANRFAGAEAETFARMKAVDEIDPMALRRADQAQQLLPLFARVRDAPALAMVRIVFRRVEIGIHAPGGAECKNRFAVLHAPRQAKESFDDTAARECFCRSRHMQNLAQTAESGKFSLPSETVLRRINGKFSSLSEQRRDASDLAYICFGLWVGDDAAGSFPWSKRCGNGNGADSRRRIFDGQQRRTAGRAPAA